MMIIEPYSFYVGGKGNKKVLFGCWSAAQPVDMFGIHQSNEIFHDDVDAILFVFRFAA